MRFGGYILEILVNDVPLPERPIKVETKRIDFEPSYYVDDITNRKVFCDMHYIIETVPKSEFKIRFRSLQVSKTRIIRGDVAVNGKTDQTCVEMYNKSFQIVTGFWHKKKFHKPFKFPSNIRSIPTSKFKYQFGGPGVISVYFYEVEKIRYPTVKKLKTTSKSYKELFWDGSSNLKSYEPIAVLHIHYRSTSWFNLLNHRQVVGKETSSIKRSPLDEISSDEESDLNVKTATQIISISSHANNERQRRFKEASEYNVVLNDDNTVSQH
ncbi:hypothetical protein C1645_822266 [Glomus cerebriforme]|uniref:Uncharacterized protein n=1 Tax=Glomus cerebriforme TaxID=658196 RepID=A0A397SZD6_9GLOM|nr:hypothetical protein C1645_822266 [Glomus cerebriforme]